MDNFGDCSVVVRGASISKIESLRYRVSLATRGLTHMNCLAHAKSSNVS